MIDGELYGFTGRTRMTESEMEQKLLGVLKSKPEITWSLRDLVTKAGISATSIAAREVIWSLIDERRIQLTADRRLKLIE
jgi:hypothetical protein